MSYTISLFELICIFRFHWAKLILVLPSLGLVRTLRAHVFLGVSPKSKIRFYACAEFWVRRDFWVEWDYAAWTSRSAQYTAEINQDGPTRRSGASWKKLMTPIDYGWRRRGTTTAQWSAQKLVQDSGCITKTHAQCKRKAQLIIEKIKIYNDWHGHGEGGCKAPYRRTQAQQGAVGNY